MWIKKKNLISTAVFVLAAGFLFLLYNWYKNQDQIKTYERTDVLMGTNFQGTVYGGREDILPDLVRELRKLEAETLSWREESSEISRINSKSGQRADEDISDELSGYLKTVLDMSQKSNGAIDPTIGSISRLWDFGGKNQRLPDEREIKSLLQSVGYEKLRLEGKKIFLPQDMNLDLGAVGKGIGADRAADFVKNQEGIHGAVIAIGGSIALIGNKPDGSAWMLAIASPRGETGEILGVLTLSGDCFVSTSGDYEKYFIVEGKRYHHILNPHTGYPAESGLISVTIVCDSGLRSDGLSTACFVLGLEKGLELVKEYGAEAIFVDEEKNVYLTEGLEEFFTLKDERYKIL